MRAAGLKVLSLAAALAVLPLSTAAAQSDQSSAEKAIEEAAEIFEARMEAFGERAEAIGADDSLSEAERELRVAALWKDYEPAVASFTAEVTRHAGAIAAQALAEIDVDALVHEALKEAEDEVASAQTVALAMARNGAWAQDDPEQAYTYTLIAQHAMDEASQAIGEALADVDVEVEIDIDHDDAR